MTNEGGPERLRQRKEFPATVVRRKVSWSEAEKARIANNLSTKVGIHPNYPQYLILRGHFSREEVQDAIGSRDTLDITLSMGIDELPFSPAWTATIDQQSTLREAKICI